LFAIDVGWTERASQMIETGEYRYISPVFLYDKKTGAVTRLLHAELINNLALDGIDTIAASKFLSIEALKETTCN
jgi:phage I-like protein